MDKLKRINIYKLNPLYWDEKIKHYFDQKKSYVIITYLSEDTTYYELAKKVGVTEERIRQIFYEGLRYLSKVYQQNGQRVPVSREKEGLRTEQLYEKLLDREKKLNEIVIQYAQQLVHEREEKIRINEKQRLVALLEEHRIQVLEQTHHIQLGDVILRKEEVDEFITDVKQIEKL